MSIVPDNKDWTWVMVRSCPECGFDPREVDVRHMPQQIEQVADSWAVVLGRPRANVRPSPDKWSDLEYACHVRDVFTLFHSRLDAMIAVDGARFENWDQDATAVESAYNSQEPARVSLELVDAARGLAGAFSLVGETQWENRGFRSNGTEFTVESFARYLLHDLVHHLWDVGNDAVVVERM